MPETIPAALAEAAAERPPLEAVVDGDLRLTFAELEVEARRTAAALVAAGARTRRPGGEALLR